jgi:hypothetical protein
VIKNHFIVTYWKIPEPNCDDAKAIQDHTDDEVNPE